MKMRKRMATTETEGVSPKSSSHQQHSCSLNGSLSSPFCYWFSLAIAIQLFLLCLIVLALYTDNSSPSQISCGSSKREDHALTQIHFLHKTGSRLPQLYQQELLPSLNETTKKLKAIHLSEFCKGDLAKSRPKYAIFRDVVMAERNLYIPSAIVNCSMVPRDIFLETKFNRGQKSTPKIDIMVIPSAETLEKSMEPHLSCHERVYEPSILLSFINWPQYGHAMFNGISLLWETFSGPLLDVGKNVRLYAYGDSIVSHERQTAQQNSPFFDMKTLEPLMSMFSHHPVRSLANLLMQSDRHPVCFSYLVVGLSGDLDHYNFHAPLNQWRDFANAVKSHFNVRDPPRIMQTGILQRVAPQDALKGSDPDKELGEIKKISWKDLSGRPRLTIMDRKSNRVIINVRELEQIAIESGYFKNVEVVYLEDMKMEEQIEVMGKTDVLFGMDGTGMMNGIFLPEGGVVVHVRPYGCKQYLSGKGVNFNRLWAANPGRVIRHESGDIKSSRFPSNVAEVPELVFNKNSSVSYRFGFILKQDTAVHPTAFRCIMETSHKLLHGLQVEWHQHYSCTRSVFY